MRPWLVRCSRPPWRHLGYRWPHSVRREHRPAPSVVGVCLSWSKRRKRCGVTAVGKNPNARRDEGSFCHHMPRASGPIWRKIISLNPRLQCSRMHSTTQNLCLLATSRSKKFITYWSPVQRCLCLHLTFDLALLVATPEGQFRNTHLPRTLSQSLSPFRRSCFQTE